MYTPTVRGGRPMSVGMLCLGRHWNARTYGYEAAPLRLRRPARAADPGVVRRAGGRRRGARRLHLRPRHLHRQLLHRDEPDGRAPGQGRAAARRSTPACRSCRCRSATPRGSYRRADAPRADPAADAALGRRAGDGRRLAPALPRRDALLPGTAPRGTGPGRFNLTFRQVREEGFGDRVARCAGAQNVLARTADRWIARRGSPTADPSSRPVRSQP